MRADFHEQEKCDNDTLVPLSVLAKEQRKKKRWVKLKLKEQGLKPEKNSRLRVGRQRSTMALYSRDKAERAIAAASSSGRRSATSLRDADGIWDPTPLAATIAGCSRNYLEAIFHGRATALPGVILKRKLYQVSGKRRLKRRRYRARWLRSTTLAFRQAMKDRGHDLEPLDLKVLPNPSDLDNDSKTSAESPEATTPAKPRVVLHENARSAFVDGKPKRLTKRQLKVIKALLEAPGRKLTITPLRDTTGDKHAHKAFGQLLEDADWAAVLVPPPPNSWGHGYRIKT
jgi:hypothetical protein